MPRINVYIGADTLQSLERRRAKLAKRNLRFEVSHICEAAIRKALGFKEKK